jgi:ParB-like chromosome segregation protein Spo0J
MDYLNDRLAQSHEIFSIFETFFRRSFMSKLLIEYIDVERLIPSVNNPRNNKTAVDKVAGSIKEFGFKNPVIVDKNMVIIAGYRRISVARKLGLKDVPVIRIEDLTPEQIKAFRITDNNVAELAEWHAEKLATEFEELNMRRRCHMRKQSKIDDSIIFISACREYHTIQQFTTKK